MSEKIKVGIVGGTGYTAGELLRLLVHHPAAEIAFVYSTSSSGMAVTSAHTDLAGDTDLCFTDKVVPADVVFLCLGHGISRRFLTEHPFPPETKIIDLGNDFRTDPLFGNEGSGRRFVYGLPEINRPEIITADNVANPGCFATAIQLSLAPLAAAGLLTGEVHVTATTGSTGAGRTLSQTTHFI